MKKYIFLFLGLIFASCSTNPIPQTSPLKYGAVSAASPEATQAGMYILEKGGNAADAAIAIALVLGVTEPAMSGIGGGIQVQMLVSGRKPFAINGSTLSPSNTPTVWDKEQLTLHKRTTIPSTLKVLEYLFKTYGSGDISWATLCQPAINHAKHGFKVGEYRKKVFEKYKDKLSRNFSYANSQIINDDGKVIQPELANALQLIANRGADAFYKGEIAKAIEEDMKNNGGWIRYEDLASFDYPKEKESISFNYKGYTIYTQPEPCGGWIVKEILQSLEANNDQQKNYWQNLAEAIRKGHYKRKTLAQKTKLSNKTGNGETTHFSVMDANGMVLSVTASINAYYGASVAIPEYGILYNSYMDDFIFNDPDNKYAIGPSKMAYSSMSPTIVMKDGEMVLTIGSPGSARIISTVAQLIDHHINQTTDPEKLLQLPRIHAINNKLYIETKELMEKFPLEYLAKIKITEAKDDLSIGALNPYFGGVHAIILTSKGYKSLADPRRDGLALTK